MSYFYTKLFWLQPNYLHVYSALIMPQPLERFLDLNISRENELQNIVTLAAETCQTPIAMLSIYEGGKVASRYKAGTLANHVPDKHYFSYLPLEANQVTVIPDTLRDPRTASIPLVTGSMRIRFFAGIPLVTHDNKTIGTLYVMGREPKELSQRRKGMLKILSQQAVNMVEFDLSLRALKQQFIESKNSENKLRSFFESSKSAHVLLDRNLEILTFNKAFYEAIRLLMQKDVQIGMNATECIMPAYLNDFLKNTKLALSGKSIQHERILESDGVAPFWTRIAYNPAFDGEGNIIGVSFNATDITKRKQSEQQIVQQNEALRKIAYMQSHELRKPVANILGLMNLIKMNGNADNGDLLKLMEETVMQLDDTIHHIVKTANDYPAALVIDEAGYNTEIQKD
ncbi:PAS domain S-box protein [Mucilaginibacter lacusdianchii]|uniref:PAS domain S-box protein n=1 Tax=Mucilaginibacter lacusdianchii TaxID=2684211 RepID=UPI00131C7B29|nr:PAS domain S-box protein [Mucilaginibacter sp. JXJ CY 39]